jgi:hypothetical protein
MRDFLELLRSLTMLVLLIAFGGFVAGLTYGLVERLFVFGRGLIL